MVPSTRRTRHGCHGLRIYRPFSVYRAMFGPDVIVHTAVSSFVTDGQSDMGYFARSIRTGPLRFRQIQSFHACQPRLSFKVRRTRARRPRLRRQVAEPQDVSEVAFFGDGVLRRSLSFVRSVGTFVVWKKKKKSIRLIDFR